ncbi:hypothetical protein H2200_006534 [Cladophialophora chaetospira]|uniref:AMP-activated protein kinase glycogen-binding domain-containing protein n=1 Tax=Cladophialophora chaetospira TaxID=386627 RepID=A0AA38X8D9_9EURO|nr:hypothetical protein H2200_006534 [Cladophialophora chaetospira]
MVSTTITFEKDGVQPPVFVAGGFTKWEPIEMRHGTTESNGPAKNVFSHKTELEAGEYQYKFRLGPGDWWVLDESKPTAPDESGNLNNVLSVVEPQHSKAPTELPNQANPTLTAHATNTNEVPAVEEEPKLNGSAEHKETAEPYPHLGEVVAGLHDSEASEGSQAAPELPRSDSEKQVQFDEQTGRITADGST